MKTIIIEMVKKNLIKFPFILKTPVSKGSKDVFLIHSIKEYKKTINDLKTSSQIPLFL